MKKYLMMGAAALLMGASFTSCSSDNDLYDPQANATKFLQAYESAFIEVFGTPAANQTWGFGDAAASRMTRANPGDDVYPATHEYKDANGNVIAGANMNHNEWADPDKKFGGWIVPDPLTEGQKLRVQLYFQANPNLAYEDPHYRHFFVQQVYKGATAAGSNSTEVVTAADGSTYTSANMNHLTVGVANSHINDFNSGTCSASNVLNNGESVGGASHSDQITLMVNVYDTTCFGYHDSGSSNQSSDSPNHNDKMALVSAATIDAWAAANGNPGEAVVDKWNRSFMGFDLAIKEGAQAYATDNAGNVQYATYSQGAESPRFAWDGEKIIEIAEQSAATGWQVVYKEGYETIMNVGWLTTNKNFYVAADQVTMPQTLSMNRAQASTITTIQNAPVLKDVMDGDTYYQSIINLPRIKQLVDAGYLPINNKSLAEWVKVGVSDGYFSDCIVTLTEAQRIPEPENPSLHVMAEDLSATDASDFDFNDVVFDVIYVDEHKVQIKLLAAGGTLPLRLCENDNWEVHKLFNVDVKCMVNTGTKYHVARDPYSQDTKPYVTLDYYTPNFTWSNIQNEFAAQVNTMIPIEVEYEEGNWLVVPANPGEPAGKIASPISFSMEDCDWYPEDYRWAWEKQGIATIFRGWVANPDKPWYSNN